MKEVEVMMGDWKVDVKAVICRSISSSLDCKINCNQRRCR